MPAAVRFPISEAELPVVEQVVSLTRELCKLPTIVPGQLVGIARALYAWQKLPCTSPGVSVEYSVSLRSGREDDGDQFFYTFSISDSIFEVGTSLITYHSQGSNSQSTALWEVEASGYRNFPSDDEQSSLDVWLAMEQAKEMLAQNAPRELHLDVTDDSAPDCIPDDESAP